MSGPHSLGAYSPPRAQTQNTKEIFERKGMQASERTQIVVKNTCQTNSSEALRNTQFTFKTSPSNSVSFQGRKTPGSQNRSPSGPRKPFPPVKKTPAPASLAGLSSSSRLHPSFPEKHLGRKTHALIAPPRTQKSHCGIECHGLRWLHKTMRGSYHLTQIPSWNPQASLPSSHLQQPGLHASHGLLPACPEALPRAQS